MTTKQENRFTMQLVTRDYLNNNSGIVATLPNCGGYVTAMQTGITQIQVIREQQEVDKSGLAESKNQLKSNLISLAMDTSRRVAAYASYANNLVLLNEINYSESDLKRCADTILRDSCQVIYSRANTNANVLVSYGVTPAGLTSMLSAITSFAASIPAPRLGITDKKQATDQLTILMKAVDDNLDKIDTLVEMVKVSQPVFYKGYKDARKIIEIGGNSLVAKGKVTDSENGESLQGATVKFTADGANTSLKLKNADSNGNLIKRTASKGGFNIKSLPEGTYTMTVSKPGYKDSVITVNVTDGETTDLHVKLEKK